MTEKLIILDIDETLIHAIGSLLDIGCDFKAEAYFVCRRPFLQEFLDFCFSNFKVAVLNYRRARHWNRKKTWNG